MFGKSKFISAIVVAVLAIVIGNTEKALAQDQMDSLARGVNPNFISDSFFQDYNADGSIVIAAFGDSITTGRGDSTGGRDAGYPLRIEALAGVDTRNLGHPGEELSLGAVPRFAHTIPGIRPDLVVFLEGVNDTFAGLSDRQYYYDVQTMVNIAEATGALPLLVTQLPYCEDHSGSQRFTNVFNNRIHELARQNNILIADAFHAFNNSGGCNLFNRPEGLHPNTNGYDVLAEVIIASLLNINIFAPEGPAQFEAALDLPAGSVRTRPDPEPVPVQ